MSLPDSSKIEILKILERIDKATEVSVRSALVAEAKEKVLNYEKPKEELWKSPTRNIWVMGILVLAVIGSTVKLFPCLPMSESYAPPPLNPWDLGIYIFWVVMPPIFFLIEYVHFFGQNPSNRLNPEQTADLKYVQELGSKVWAAIIVGFGIFLLIRYKLEVL